jgi:hypothetical protein
VRLHHPEIFRQYRPAYPDAAPAPVPKPVVPGPYEHMLCRWCVLAFVLPGLVLPLILLPLAIADDSANLARATT